MTDPTPTPTTTPPQGLTEEALREQWNAQADEFNTWDSLDSAEQFAWAQKCAIAAHEAALAAERPQPVPGWQPIDTAPHDGTEILASDYDAIEILTWSWDAWETGSGWINRNAHELHEAIRPAWWQPLPDHPPIPQPPQANTTHPTPTEPNGTN